jgi:class 3 adenylate cyclase
MSCGKTFDIISPSTKESRLSALQHAAPEQLREKMRLSSSQIEGERKPVTILFTDIVGSTAIAEKLDPEVWKEIISGAHQRVGDAIYRYEGTIAQLLGDGVLAFFGAPITHEDDPIRAVHAAMDIQESVKAYALELGDIVGDFQMRIGINTGTVVIGEIGTDMHMEYLAIGDAVNVAARLQSAAEPGKVVLSKPCARLVSAEYDLKDLGEITVKGKADPLQAFELMGAKEEPETGRGIEGLPTPYVGREREIEKLQSSLLALRGGHGQIVTVIGDAGIGKTRHLEEVMAIVHEDEGGRQTTPISPSPIRWLEGRALSYGGSLSYWTITQLLLADLGLSDGAPQVEIKVAMRRRAKELFSEERANEVLPYLAHLLGLKGEVEVEKQIQSLDGESLKKQTLKSVSDYFGQVADKGPTVLVFEDVHWSDPSSLEALEGLLALTDRMPLMILMLMRIDRDHGSWGVKIKAETDFPHRTTEIHLRRLSEGDSSSLLEKLLGETKLPEEIWRIIMERSEGNPFYLEEVIRHLMEQALIVQDEEGWHATEELEEMSIPDTLQGVLLARIDRLEEDVRTTLQIASVIGKSFLFRILDSITEAEYQLEVHLSQLQRVDLVREKSRWPELEYIFKHSLTQEAAYNSILHERRRMFHRRVGEALEELFPDRIEDFLGLLAHHFLSAETYEKAADYLSRAADNAFSKGSLREAIGFRTRALEMYMKLEDLVMVGHMEMELGGLHWFRGDRQAALEHANRSVSILEHEGETKELAMAIAEVSRLHMVASNYDQAIKWGERALELAERLEEQEVVIHVLNTVGASHAQSGEIESGLAELQESLRLSLELDMPGHAGRAYYNLGEMLIHVGNYAEARLHYEEFYNFSLRYDFDYQEDALLALTFLNWLCGSWASAIDQFSTINNKMFFGLRDIWSRRVFALIYNDLGKVTDACQELECLASIAVRSGELQTVVPYLGQMARAYDALGREKEALRVIQQYLEFIDRNPYFDAASIMPLLFACQWYCNYSAPESFDEVRACVSRLQKAHEQLGTPEAEAALAEGYGSLALVEEHGPQAVKYFQDAVKIWEVLGRPYDQARALGGYGQALVNANDLDAARSALDEAKRIFESLADQLEDSEMRSSFLTSQLVDGIRQERENLEIGE